MPELNYQVVEVAHDRFAAAPQLLFTLRVAEAVADGSATTSIRSVILRCQVRVEPGRRAYSDAERQRLRDLFGTPERWGQTLRPMPWVHIVAVVPPFDGTTEMKLPIPCSFDFSLAVTRYFSALDGGDLPLCFLFSGTIFYEGDDGALQVGQISWEKEATFRLPAATWHELASIYYPNTAWMCMRKDLFDLIDQFKSDHGLTNHDEAIERLLLAAKEPMTP